MLPYAPMTLTCSSVGCLVASKTLESPAVTELLLDWLDPFLAMEEQDRLLGWRLGVSL